jgi:hypothetical protein
MTSWTKVTDETTSYTDVDNAAGRYDDSNILYDSLTFVYDYFKKVVDGTDQWAPFGGLLYLATEGGDILANEDESVYLVVSKGSDGVVYTDVADQSTSWTKVSDA